MVEHRTAVPVVIGSNPIVPFFFLLGNSIVMKIIKIKKEQNNISYDSVSVEYVGWLRS